MSSTRDSYIRLGYKPESFEVKPSYLAELSCAAAVELDNHRLGRNNDFQHTQELAGILDRYLLPADEKKALSAKIPYLPLWQAMQRQPEKTYRETPQLTLDLRLLATDLHEIPNNPDKIAGLQKILIDISKEMMYAAPSGLCRRRLVA